MKHLGVPIEPIRRNARAIVEKGVPMIIRIPLVPTLTDTEENIQAIAHFVKQLDPKLTVHLLPYHKFGVSKYSMLDRKYEIDVLETQSEEHLAELVQYFETCGLGCEIVK